MRFGMCTDIATSTRDRVEYALLEKIKATGFDYVEFPLMMIDTLSDEDFEFLLSELKRLDLNCDCSCNYFPGRIKVTGYNVNMDEIKEYLDHAMGRAARMGVKKIVFGSNNSRNLPEGETIEEGYEDIRKLLTEAVIPACQKYDIVIVMEPLRHQSANFIITLPDGAHVVNMMKTPEIQLLADLMHMNYNEEDPESIRDYIGMIQHVHLCERDRMIPEDGYSAHLQHCLNVLKDLGYDGTISFEAKGGSEPDGMKKALTQLKAHFAN